MKPIFKFLHLIGMVLFLGSILTFTLISIMTKGGTLENLFFARQIISTGTYSLTLHGIGLILLGGGYMAIRNRHYRERWLQVKLFLMALILLNTVLLILPAETEALALAKASVESGALLKEYGAAYIKESLPGAVNILLILASAAIGVRRIEGGGK